MIVQFNTYPDRKVISYRRLQGKLQKAKNKSHTCKN